MKWLFITFAIVLVSSIVFGADGVGSVVIGLGRLIKKIKFKGIF